MQQCIVPVFTIDSASSDLTQLTGFNSSIGSGDNSLIHFNQEIFFHVLVQLQCFDGQRYGNGGANNGGHVQIVFCL